MEPERLEQLLELASVLGQQNDFQETLRVVVQKAASLLNAEIAVIAMINPQTRHTVKTLMREGRENEALKWQAVQTYVSGWVIKNQKPLASADLKADPRFAKNLFEGIPIKSVLAVPLRAEGFTLGALILLDIKPLEPPDTKNEQPAIAIHPGSNIQNQVSRTEQLEHALFYLEKFATFAAPYLRNVQKIQQYFEAPIPEATLLAKYEGFGLLGKSKKFVELLQAVEAAARCEVRVLLEGESGTGKELIARAIHRLSNRSDRPFIAIDCGAIPENLIESELFGHVKGAFTGATAERKGLLEEANLGTLFMDEITSLPMEMQAKFMRMLQEGEVRPLGSNKTRHVDVRIISASSMALRTLVEQQKFREDLYYRLHVYPIHVPSLDERHDDIPLLASHFLKKFSSQQRKQAAAFHEEILDFLQERHWAGNVRELENFVERLVTLGKPNMAILGRDLLPHDLLKELQKIAARHDPQTAIKSLQEGLSEFETQFIREALIANHWNQAKTARQLRIAEQTLRYKMGRLGIERPSV
jgi:transcriptional regulator with GAF, ATPase, and Fis domain